MASKYQAIAKRKYQYTVDAKVCGIPCWIAIRSYRRIKPDHNTWASSDDYYGGVECEWDILDNNYRPAGWLYKKAEQTRGEFERIDDLIVEFMES